MNLNNDVERDLERMIDGELSFSEQRSLLNRLEVLPDGWRRLALGLLEEQAFHREFQQISPRLSPASPVATVPSPPMASPRQLRQWLKRVVLGAVCAGCLAAGMQIEQVRSRNGAPAENVPLASIEQTSIPSAEEPVAGPMGEKSASVSAQASDKLRAQNEAAQSSADEMTPHQTLKVVFADWPTPIEVPVVETTDDEANDLLAQSAVSEDLRREWESAGYVIYEDRRYVPVPLSDGRQGIAPISEIVVEYVGTDEYQ
jgi:hypothetical protein